jgi:ATP-dependent protease ClpP protease subunit
VAGWKELLDEVQKAGSTHDIVRRRYLRELTEQSGRNTIAYYSAWLAKPQIYAQAPEPFSVNDTDKNGFMTAIKGLDRSKGLDLLLHTPGGDVAAAESLVSYLRSMFGTDIRAIVPQLAMSAGTMIACASDEIVMGRQSSLGPIDPQMGGLAAHAIVEEFHQAAEEIRRDPATIPLWQPIIAKYPPTLIGECQKAIKWSQTMVREWLLTGMFRDDPKADDKATQVLNELGDHALTLSHARHIDIAQARKIGLRVAALEPMGPGDFQDAVLTVHHACVQTLSDTPAIKLIENQNGDAFVQSATIGVAPVAAPS